MKISVKNLQGADVREIELADAIFDYPYKEHLIHTVVRAIQAAKRSGTHATGSRKTPAAEPRARLVDSLPLSGRSARL